MSEQQGENSFEEDFIAKIIETGEVNWINSEEVKPEHFSKKNKKVLEFILQFYRDLSEVPQPQTIEKETGVEINTSTNLEKKEYYVNRLRDKVLQNTINNKLKGVIQTNNDGNDPQKALEKLHEATIEGRRIKKKEEDRTIKVGSDESKEKLQKGYTIYKNMDIVGVETPWESLSKATRGWQNGSVNVLIGTVGVGKTWTLCLSAIEAYKNGNSTLFCSLEMPSSEVLERIFCMYAGVSYNDFLRGDLSGAEEKEMNNAIERLKKQKDTELILQDLSTVKSVGDLEMEIISNDPDLVVLDAAYMLDHSSSAEGWRKIKTIIEECKKIAVEQYVPILLSTQFNGEVDEGEIGDINNIAYARDIGVQADTCIAIAQDEDMERNNEMEAEIIKGRAVDIEYAKEDLVFEWDLQNMSFDDLTFQKKQAGKSPINQTNNTNNTTHGATPKESIPDFAVE